MGGRDAKSAELAEMLDGALRNLFMPRPETRPVEADITGPPELRTVLGPGGKLTLDMRDVRPRGRAISVPVGEPEDDPAARKRVDDFLEDLRRKFQDATPAA